VRKARKLFNGGLMGFVGFCRNAETDGKRGPIVLVVGPTDVGKTTLSRVLINYAVRLGRRPIYVDVDVGQGNISVPGTIGAMLIERPASIEDCGFIQQAPMVYFFGHKSPQDNIPLYNLLCSKLAETVHERMESNRKGMVFVFYLDALFYAMSEKLKDLINCVTSRSHMLTLLAFQLRRPEW
jgi:energy-coupling factor transporter ATP-binding protein EcfA2